MRNIDDSKSFLLCRSERTLRCSINRITVGTGSKVFEKHASPGQTHIT